MAKNATAQIDLEKFKSSAWGQQDLLVITSVPADASPALIGQPLLGQVLTVNGDYDCLISLSGMASTIQAHIKATLATKTATLELVPLYYVSNPGNVATWTDKGTPDTSALVDGVLSSVEFTTLAGEQFARCTLVVAGAAGSVTVTQAEYNGL